MDDKKVTVPLMVRSHEDIQYVDQDNDTISENEPSTGIKRNSKNTDHSNEHVNNEITPKEMPKNFLGIPKFSTSRSTSTESSDGALPFLSRSSSKKKHSHEYEKLSGIYKKSAVERITDGSFFRRRYEMSFETRRADKSDDEEHILEALRHVVRKCTSIDPVKRPSSTDVLDLLAAFNDKS